MEIRSVFLAVFLFYGIRRINSQEGGEWHASGRDRER